MASTLPDLAQSLSLNTTVKTTIKSFAELPVELRLKIWKESLKEARDVNVRVVTARVEGVVKTAFKLIGKAPALLYVNSESRTEALKVYGKAFRTSTHLNDNIYINPAIDTLIIHIHNPMSKFQDFILQQTIRAEDDSYMHSPSIRNTGRFGHLISSGVWGDIKQLEYGSARVKCDFFYVFSAATRKGRPYEKDHGIGNMPSAKEDIKRRVKEALERGLVGPIDNLDSFNLWDAERWDAACGTLVYEENLRFSYKLAYGLAS